ncbi:MAG: NTP transferase domain-containing protein [Candidatus Paceibacterota bacterium]
MNNYRLIVPAAGKGSRLNTEIPKIFTLINEKETIYDRILQESEKIFGNITLILSPDGEKYLQEKGHKLPSNVEIRIQEHPTGMFDALDLAIDDGAIDAHHKKICIQWGDQPFIDGRIYKKMFNELDHFDAAIPLVWVQDPYVQFKFLNQELTIFESREGDQCDLFGFKDMGLFAFDEKKLIQTWRFYKGIDQYGRKTGEKSFLKLLPHFLKLNSISWIIDQPTYKALGINTKNELMEAKFLLDQINQMKSRS